MSMPVFLKGGSIVPLGPNLKYADQKQADTIELRVYPGANGSFTLYEDEGDGYNYETGKYSTIPITYTDNPKNLIVGARTGSFTGMLTNRVFKVVYVASGHGAGIATTANADFTLNYTGSAVSTTGVGVKAHVGESAFVRRMATLKTAGNIAVLGNEFAGKSKFIALYDLGGKLVAAKAVRTDMVDLRKDLGVSSGVYILKVQTLP
jgi:hypothetical protein